jgi:predicted  nucleic acid-binding Zn-ribbon protein
MILLGLFATPSLALTKVSDESYELTAEEIVDLNTMRKQLEDEVDHWKSKYELAEAELARRAESELRKDQLQKELVANLEAQIALYKANESLYNQRIAGKDQQILTLGASRTFQNVTYGLLGVGIGLVIQ